MYTITKQFDNIIWRRGLIQMNLLEACSFIIVKNQIYIIFFFLGLIINYKLRFARNRRQHNLKTIEFRKF